MGSGRFTEADVTDIEFEDAVEDEDMPGGLSSSAATGSTGVEAEVAQEIPIEQWVNFFTDWTDRYLGKTVTLETVEPDGVDTSVIAEGLPLVGISADFKDRSADIDDEGEGTIQIMVGDEASDHITHTVVEPTFVYRYQSSSGADEAIEIESATGPTTVIRF